MNAAKPASDETTTPSGGFSAEERAAMKQRAAELRAEAKGARGAAKAAAEEQGLLDKIAEMPQPDRALAEALHALVITSAPHLAPKLFYGQPAYAKNDQVVCFFRMASADKVRYTTFGFSEDAALDEPGGLWATSFALTELSDSAAKELGELVARAAS